MCLPFCQPGFIPWVKKIPWRRGWLPTTVFLPGEFHGQRSLAGFSPFASASSSPAEVGWITATGNVLGLGVQDKPDSVLISSLEMRLVMLKLATALQYPNVQALISTDEAQKRDNKGTRLYF